MQAKCKKCDAAFEIDESLAKAKGDDVLCPKCELDMALNVEKKKGEEPEPPDADKKPSRSLVKSLFLFLKHPLVIVLSIVCGVIFGIYNKEVSLVLKPIGDVYLALLKMCVFPILITAIITSVGKLFNSKEASSYIVRILTVFIVLLVLVGGLSLSVGVMGQPGEGLSKDAQKTLGKMLSESDKKASDVGEGIMVEKKSLIEFIKSMIPENIFYSLNEGSSLQILFFAILLGVATGFLPEIESRLLLSFSESLFKAFFAIIGWILYLLPVGLFSLISSQVASTGVEILLAMTKFVVIVYIVAVATMILSAFLLWYTTGVSIFSSFARLKDCLLIGFGTQSTFASMPSQLDGLRELKVNAELSNLVVPIGAVICRFSMVMVYTVATVFTAQLYGVHLGIGGLATALFLSILAAVAGAGTPGIVSIAMIAIVLGPLGLPSGAIIVLLLGINPVIEPITTMANVHANVAATSFIAKSGAAET